MDISSLPQRYINEMEQLFAQDYENFINTYEQSSYKGISANCKKIDRDELIKKLKLYVNAIDKIDDTDKYSKVLWSDTGIYVKDDNIAKNPLYHTGAYYIQEPSAMSVVNYLDIDKDMKVLDMCASPGGKTFQISQKLFDEGMLISNDINTNRMPALIRNIEYHGLSNVVVINENQDNLSKNFPEFFDAILLDAPCSGEGMFRKDKKLISSYEKSRKELVPIQRDLLQKAATMLKYGGKLMYSTCTFNKEENEDNIIDFLKNNEEFELIDIPKEYGMTSFECLMQSARFLPQNCKGEGHFLCLMKKKSIANNKNKEDTNKIIYENKKYIKKYDLPKIYLDFEKENLNIKIDGNFFISNNSLYMEIFDKILPHKLRIVRNGLYMGDFKNNDFVMSSAFIRSLKYEHLKNTIDFEINDVNLIKYLKGETVILDELRDKDYIVCVERLPVGLGRAKNGKLKNMYNKNWRIM